MALNAGDSFRLGVRDGWRRFDVVVDRLDGSHSTAEELLFGGPNDGRIRCMD